MWLRYHLFTIIWAVIILLLTLTSGGSNANIEFVYTDKLVHLIIFLVLSFLVIVGVSKQNGIRVKTKTIITSVLLCMLYGILIEFIQYTLPQREFDYFDFLANNAGVVFGVLMFYVVYKL